MEDINKLLDKYFAGETSRDEEMKLRQYFSEANVVDELKEIKPIFSYLNEEASVFEFLRDLRSDSELSSEIVLRSENELGSESYLISERALKQESKLISDSELREDKHKTVYENRYKRRIIFFPKVIKIATIAACLMFGLFLLNQFYSEDNGITQNIVWVDGKRINDINVVRAHAESSFSNVRTEENIMEEQLTMMFK